ncbi:MAG: tRNA lysidine(34) synthetase TilS [Candidatus Omnitrophica bacterium]|nr:tRNA lysidine(34) synthetase TilS [Candidatus Omnitrophota bacterium]
MIEKKPHVFIKQVHDTIKNYDMLKNGEHVLVAVSGGPDSVCMLKTLFEISKKIHLKLTVANVDHCIRDKDSKEDSDFVKKLAESMSLDIVYKKVNIPKLNTSKESIEETARKKRYEFLLMQAKKLNCKALATGHNLDDQAETILMRVIKGSSLKGISGIPPLRIQEDIRIIRPLIRSSKKDILNFLKQENCGFCIDKTNKETKYLRNNIRLNVIPYLEKINPKLKESLVNLSDSVREEIENIEGRNTSFVNSSKIGNKAEISIEDIIFQPVYLRKKIMKSVLETKGCNIKKLTHKHWQDIDNLIRKATPGTSINLPGKITLKRGKYVLNIIALVHTKPVC